MYQLLYRKDSSLFSIFTNYTFVFQKFLFVLCHLFHDRTHLFNDVNIKRPTTQRI